MQLRAFFFAFWESFLRCCYFCVAGTASSRQCSIHFESWDFQHPSMWCFWMIMKQSQVTANESAEDNLKNTLDTGNPPTKCPNNRFTLWSFWSAQQFVQGPLCSQGIPLHYAWVCTLIKILPRAQYISILRYMCKSRHASEHARTHISEELWELASIIELIACIILIPVYFQHL